MSDSFHTFRGSCIRLSSRRVCSSALTSSQYLSKVIPESTIDDATESGQQITLERRPEDEVTHVLGVQAAPAGTRALNYAFDVTPAELVTAIVTEDRLIFPNAG